MGVGGQIAAAERIENFPGFPQGLSGAELGPILHEQAEAAGAEFILDTVEGIAIDGAWRMVHGASDEIKARAVIVAAGSTPRSLGVPGEEAFLGRGVSHCASCDGHFFSGQEVCVVGGGSASTRRWCWPSTPPVSQSSPWAALDASACWSIALAASGKIEIVLDRRR
jgi:thioredoxin reductase (NADPH)